MKIICVQPCEITKEEFYMFTLEDKSKLISDFEEIYKFRKIIDKKFYKKCKKKCKMQCLM